MVFVFGFIGIQYSEFLNNQRSYDACIERVERSEASRRFADKLIEIIDREVSNSDAIVKELRDAEVPVLDRLSCGDEPSFLTTPTTEVHG